MRGVQGRGILKRVGEWLLEHTSSALDIPYVPESLKAFPGPILLHISDTPSHIYPYILRLTRILKPEYLIHTGDIADEIKLEKNRSHIHEYAEKVPRFITGLEATSVGTIVYVIGNHDDSATVRNAAKRSIVLEESGVQDLGGVRFYLSHRCEAAQSVLERYSFDFALFGHNGEKKSDTQFLNAIFHMYVISLETKEFRRLPYPSGTDNARKVLPPKIGL